MIWGGFTILLNLFLNSMHGLSSFFSEMRYIPCSFLGLLLTPSYLLHSPLALFICPTPASNQSRPQLAALLNKQRRRAWNPKVKGAGRCDFSIVPILGESFKNKQTKQTVKVILLVTWWGSRFSVSLHCRVLWPKTPCVLSDLERCSYECICVWVPGWGRADDYDEVWGLERKTHSIIKSYKMH